MTIGIIRAVSYPVFCKYHRLSNSNEAWSQYFAYLRQIFEGEK